MEMSDTEIKSFLAIQTPERFAKLFIKYTPTKWVVISQKEIFMFNKEFNYYQPVGIRGKLMSLVRCVACDYWAVVRAIWEEVLGDQVGQDIEQGGQRRGDRAHQEDSKADNQRDQMRRDHVLH